MLTTDLLDPVETNVDSGKGQNPFNAAAPDHFLSPNSSKETFLSPLFLDYALITLRLNGLPAATIPAPLFERLPSISLQTF